MKKLYILAAAAIALTACSKEEETYLDEPVEAYFTATIGKSGLTRAVDTSWTEGDAIGISMEGRYSNIKHSTSGDGNFTGTTMYFKNKREAVTMTAYYPFNGVEGTAITAIETKTSSDKQASGAQQGIDFLYAKKENVSGLNPNVAFTFSHRMSKLTLKFINGEGANGIRVASYSVNGLILDGTFDLTEGVCAAKTGAATETIDIEVNGETDGVLLPSLILFPQSLSGIVTLTVTDSDGQYYACELKFDEDTLLAGNNYLFAITINKTGLNVNKSTITDWVTKDNSGDASSVVKPDK